MDLTMPLVLTADDSAAIQRVVQVSLTPCAIDVISADSFPAALEKTTTQQVDLIIADADLSGMTAVPELQRLTADGKIPLILLLSSYSKIDKSSLTELGFQQVLQKPFDSRELLQLVAFNLQLNPDERHSGDWQPFPTTAASESTPKATPEETARPTEATTKPPLPTLTTAAKHNEGASKQPTATTMSEANEVDHNFAALVKKAVFEYCQNNFPRIARETVLAELRRLQNEKSDSVINN